MAQLGARLDGIEEVVGSNPIGSTKKATCKQNNRSRGGSNGTSTPACAVFAKFCCPASSPKYPAISRIASTMKNAYRACQCLGSRLPWKQAITRMRDCCNSKNIP